MAFSINGMIALDGEKEFRQAVTNANTALTTLKSSVSLVDAQFKGQSNSLQALQAKYNALNNALDKSKAKQQAVQSALSNAQSSYERISKGVETLNKQYEIETKRLDEMKRSGTASTAEIEKQEGKVNLLSESIEKGNKNYQQAENRVNKWKTSLNKAETETANLERELDETNKCLDEAKNSTDGCATSIDQFGNKTKNATEVTTSFKDKLTQAVTGKAVSMGMDMLKKLGQAAIDAAKKMVEVGSSFEAAMSKVEAISGETGQSLDALSDKAKELGSSTMYTATESADALSYMALAGWDTEEMLDGIDGVLNLAAASSMDLSSASDIVTDNLSAFNMTASESGELVDKMAFAMSNSNTTTEQLGEAYKNVAATATQLGYDVDSATAALMVMADNGIKGGEAGTALSAIMTRLGNNSSGCADMLEEYGIQVYDSTGKARNLTDILGDMQGMWAGLTDAEKANVAYTVAGRSAQTELMTVLGDTTGSLQAYATGLKTCDGAAEDMAETMQDNLQGDVTKLNSALEGLGIAAYDMVKGPLRGVTQGVTAIISGLTTVLSGGQLTGALDEFIGEIEEANDDVNSMIDNAGDAVAKVDSTTKQLNNSRDVLLKYNDVTDKSAYSQYALQKAVEECSGSIPELADAYDSLTGTLSLTDDQINDLFDDFIDTGNLSDATAAVETAAAAYDAACKQNVDASDAVREAEEKLQELREQGIPITANAYKAAEKNLKDARNAEKDAADNVEQAEKIYNAACDTLDKYGSTLDDTGEHLEDAGDSAEEFESQVEQLTQELRGDADIQEQAFNDIVDTYHDAMDDIAEDLNNNLDLSKKFEYDDDVTIDSMLENLESQVQAQKDYYDNMQIIMSDGGQNISASFAKYIQDMGMDGADYAKAIADAINDGDEEMLEKLQEMSGLYSEYGDISELIAEVMGLNQVAYQEALEGFGGTEDDYAALNDSISQAVEDAAGTWGSLTDVTEEALSRTIDTAQRMGIQIPSGLAEGIESGEISAEDAIGQINDQITGSFDGLASVAEEAGIQVPAELAAAIEQGGDAAVGAMEDLLNLILQSSGQIPDAMTSGVEGSEAQMQSATAGVAEAGVQGAEGTTEEYKAIGQESADAMADGMLEEEGAITEAANTLVTNAAAGLSVDTEAFAAAGQSIGQALADGIANSDAATSTATELGASIATAVSEALSSQTAQFTTIGTDAMTTYGGGITSGQQNPVTAAGVAVTAAIAGAQAKNSGWTSVGTAAMSGVVSGINAGKSSVINAAAAAAGAALQAAKSKLGIQSPSKKFKKDVGEMIGKGMSQGIKDTSKLSEAEAEKMSEKVYNKATNWLTKYKKNHDVSKADEKYYWKQVVKECETGTAAYDKAVMKLLKTDISKKDSNGKKKDAETYYGEVYSAAEKYLQNQKELNDWSLKEELQYWEQVKKTVKKGTQAWYDAQSQINSIKKDIGTVSNMNNLIDTYKTYYELSEKAEMEYWDYVRQQYAAGTDERKEADDKYLEAKAAWTEKMEDLEKDYADSVADIEKNLADEIEDLNKQYTDAIEDRTKAIANAYSLFDEFTSSSVSGQDLLFNIQSQAAGYEAWEEAVDELADRGILSDDLLGELVEMGPDELAAIYALMDLTDEDLQAYQDAYDRKMNVALRQAEKENEDLLDDINNQISDLEENAASEIEELTQAYNEATAAASTEITDELKNLATKAEDIAADEVTALVAAMTGQELKDSDLKTSVGSNVKSTTSNTSTATTTSGSSSDAVLDAINKGNKKTSLTSSEKKNKHHLYRYLVNHYHREGGKKVYQPLSKALGLNKLAKQDSFSSDDKDKILKKLQKAGYKKGGKVNDELIWMDEQLDELGPEMVVRKADNAILTRVSPGDQVINAGTVSNMMRWGQYSPDTMMALLEKQQEKITGIINSASIAGSSAALYDLLNNAPAGNIAAGINNESINNIENLVSEFLPYLAERMNVYLDSGQLVGGIETQMSSALAMRSRRRRSA